MLESFLIFAEERTPPNAPQRVSGSGVSLILMKNLLYVGLGNVGSGFTGTRHNAGIDALRAWIEERRLDDAWQVENWQEKKIDHYQLLVVKSSWGNVKCIFPMTMMNNSGLAVQALIKKLDQSAADLMVIHDDVELPLGDVQFILGGSAKGHQGVKSVQAVLGTRDFRRLRLGVGRPPAGLALSDFVLQPFSAAEQSAVSTMMAEAAAQLTANLYQE